MVEIMRPFALLLFLSAGLIAKADQPSIATVTVDELHRKLEAGEAIALDVRGSVPFELGRIEGATWAPLGEIEKHAAPLPKDRLLVTYCTCKAEELSITGARRLLAAGFPNVAALEGGYDAWVQAGLPVARRAGDGAPPPPPVVVDTPEPVRGRLAPPQQILCAADDVTVYPGEVTKYRRRRGRVTLTIATDHDTVETVSVNGDPYKLFLLNAERFRPSDWRRVESRPGVLLPGMRAHAWVCTSGKAIIDWRPPAQ